MRNLVNWEDQEVEYPDRYLEIDLGNGYIEHKLSPGRVRQAGTPQNARNFNTMDYAALEAMLMAAETLRMLRFLQDDMADEQTKTKVTQQDLKEQGDKLQKAITDLSSKLSQAITDGDTAEAHKAEMLRNTTNELIRSLRLTENAVTDETGFFVTVTLTNNQKYPANNSQKTVTFPASLLRDSKYYSVTPEIVERDGFVKDIDITEKLLNGFKIAYTGSAKSATIRLYVKGGKTALNGLPYGITV